MFCARCGQQLPEGSQACPQCGQPVNWIWQPAPPPPLTPGQPAGTAPAAQYAAPVAYASYTPQGVGGALLFFCICFTILWPIWNLGQYAFFTFRLTAISALALARLVLGIIVGAMLWSRQAAAMVLLRIYLIAGAALMLYSVFNLLQFAARYRFSILFSWRILMSTGTSLVFLAAAILYFSLSERVRATYGSKLFG